MATDKLCIGSEDGLQFGSSPQFSKKVATSKIKKRAGLGNKFFTERFRPLQRCHRRSWVRICFVSGFLSPRSSHNVLRCFLQQLGSEQGWASNFGRLLLDLDFFRDRVVLEYLNIEYLTPTFCQCTRQVEFYSISPDFPSKIKLCRVNRVLLDITWHTRLVIIKKIRV